MTQAETRYGCFLPDLTGLARDLSTASLPERLYQAKQRSAQGRKLEYNSSRLGHSRFRHRRESGGQSHFATASAH